MPGVTNRVFDEMVSSDLFVMSSRVEGFPMALLEAMSLGLPAVAFNCPSGPRQMINHGVNGILVPAGDVRALSLAMAKMMGSANERKRIGEAATEVRIRFSLDNIMKQWDQLISNAVKSRIECRDGAACHAG
jgi:glycosyltransferase involved in cell wall biosynthesis